MKNFAQLTCNAISLDVTGFGVLNDWPIFSGGDRHQQRGSFVCKHRRTEETKKKMYRSLFIKDLLTIFLKDIKLLQFYIVPWESEAITK